MNDSSHDARAGRLPMIVGGIALVGVIALLLLIPTCRPSSTDGKSSSVPAPEDGISRSQCERSLASAIEGLQPNRLELTSESRVMVDTLNNWMTQCLPDEASVASADDAALRERLLLDNGLTRTNLERFQELDANHIRNSLLAKAIVDRLVADARTDLDRSVALFYYVVRTLELIPDEAIDLPLTPYESLLFGVGTAADRAWTYALLLRQLRLDCVMLQPRTAGDEVPYWIIGVVIPGEGVALFDPRLGLPISASRDAATSLPRDPAMLRQVRENDELLRQFDGDAPYPLTAPRLQSVDVFAIGTSSAWAPRMGLLQADLPEPVELYDGLASSRIRETGLIDRLVAAGERGLWSAGQVHVWPYPETRWGAELTEQQQALLEGRFYLLEGPFTIYGEQDPKGQVVPVVEKPKVSLRRARIEQLLGNTPLAQQVYLQTRLSPYQSFEQLPLEEVHVNYLAAGMATYWAAQCQYEQGDYRVAAESAIGYLKRGDGQFMLGALYLAAVSLAQDENPADAAALLSQQPPQAPQFPGNQQLVERWRMQAGDGQRSEKATEPADKAPSEPDKQARPADGSSASDTDARPHSADEIGEETPAAKTPRASEAAPLPATPDAPTATSSEEASDAAAPAETPAGRAPSED